MKNNVSYSLAMCQFDKHHKVIFTCHFKVKKRKKTKENKWISWRKEKTCGSNFEILMNLRACFLNYFIKVVKKSIFFE